MRDRLSGNEKLLLLCNPQNPGGTVYRRDELLQHHQFAREHDLIVCSDEIHCELLLEPGVRHTPFATLNDDAAQRSVTLMSPSKTFNLAGLGASLAIVPNEALRQRLKRSAAASCRRSPAGAGGGTGGLSIRAALAGRAADLSTCQSRSADQAHQRHAGVDGLPIEATGVDRLQRFTGGQPASVLRTCGRRIKRRFGFRRSALCAA